MVRFDLPSLYQPVDSAKGQIRLLVLHPSELHPRSSRTIRCDLEYVHLSSKPQYEALSYTWGTEGETPCEIRLAGQQFEVRENLAAALYRLRHPKKTRTLWVDAICINQEDPAERAAHVLLMKKIYSQASQVRVWLGESGDAGIVGMRMLQKKVLGGAAHAHAHWTKWKIHVDREWARPALWNKKATKQSAGFPEKGNLDEEFTLGEVRELLTRPWWRRMWAVQEAVVASKIVLMCGEETAPWESVEKFHQYVTKSRGTSHQQQAFGHPIHERNPAFDDGYQTISEYRARWQHTSPPSDFSILEFLYRFRNFDCEDPRDRIFAFLGIAPSTVEMGIVPDYESSLTQVYAQFTRKVITATESLDILSFRREWRGVKAAPPPENCYSLLQQSRYYDVDAEVTDGPDTKPRRGWARLPDGWERIPQGKASSAFFDHNTGIIYDRSPLEGQPPVPAEDSARGRVLSPGWTRTWNNIGLPQVQYGHPDKVAEVDNEHGRESEQAELSDLPSWAPNWAMPTPWDPVPLLDWSQLPSNKKQRFFASGDTRCNLSSPATENSTSSLLLKGYVLDTISQTAAPWHPQGGTIPPLSAKGTDPFPAWESLAIAPALSLLDNSNGTASSSSLDGPYTQISHPELTTSPRFEAFLHTIIAANPPAAPTITKSPNSSNININISIDNNDSINSNNNNNSLVPPPNPETSTANNSTNVKTLESLLHAKSFLTWSPPPPSVPSSSSSSSTYESEFFAHFNALSIPVVTSLLNSDGDLVDYFDPSRAAKAYGEILTRVLKTCAHRRLFVTSEGYLGLGGWDAEVGDLVVVLEGGATPFLLRRRRRTTHKSIGIGKGGGPGGPEKAGERTEKEEEEEWDLVGETYVHGVMGGEILKMGLERREFKIV